MSKKMTPRQREAVETLSGDLAISAGAGSGKTTVLAHRFAHALKPEARPPWAPAELDRILTITFTNKAAGEIAERARRVVNAEVSVEQGRRIDEAWISTIHTLCGRLIRRHILESGVEPGFALADEVTTRLMMADAFELAASELCGTDDGVASLLESWETPQLRELVASAHASIRAMGLDPSKVRVPDGLEWVEPLRDEVARTGAAFLEAVEACKQTASVAEKSERLAAWCSTFASCTLDESDFCERFLSLEDSYDISRLPTETKGAHEAFKDARKSLRGALLAAQRAVVLGGLETLVREVARRYERIKAEASSLDFDDLQERAVALLETNPQVAARYREHFRLLMIDEFQDTNELQMRVLSTIRNDNLCVVGDERQSIYGFRYADVEIFERTRAAMASQVELKDNFRSHAGVLGFVNEAFSQQHLFGSEFMQLCPKRDADWKLDLPVDAPRVECLFVGQGDASAQDARAVEAESIAARITSLLAETGVRCGDIAILLRAATHAGDYASALERHGIPALVTAGVGLFSAPETSEVKALLRAIAVPGDEEALITVLAGRMVRLSDDALLALRPPGTTLSLSAALRAVAVGELGAPELPDGDTAAARYAYDVLEWFGAHQGRLRLGELLRRACEAFDYDLTLLSAGSAGIRSWANVLKLARLADSFEATESRDVAAFVDHLAERMDASKEKAASAEAGDEAIRIMTVHAAKGLEFPVVFVADLGVDKERAADAILVARGGTTEAPVPLLGVRLPSEPESLATGLHTRVATNERQRRMDEEKRCLYVACTRAEELLVVSGTCRLDKEAREGRLLIDWIREAVGESDEDGHASSIATPVAVTEVVAEPAEPADAEDAGGASPRAPIFALEHFEPESAPRRTAEPPQSVSFSALSLHEKCPLSYHAVYTLHLSKFRRPGVRSSTEFGSAVHGVLQAADAQGVADGVVEAAVLRYELDGADTTRLRAAVAGFLGSKLGIRAYAGDRVGREVPLRVGLGPTALEGNIDLISWSGSSALVVDYKTGKAPSEGDHRREKAYLLQAQCYALAALESGAEQVEVVFCFVDHESQTVSFEFSTEDAGALRSELQRRVGCIVEDEITHLESYEAGVCEQCPALGGICPVNAPGEA